MKSNYKHMVGALLLTLAGTACAEQDGGAKATANKKDAPATAKQQDGSLDAVKAKINAGLQTARPDLKVDRVETTPMKGIYKAHVGTGPSIYITGDGKNFLVGDMYAVLPGRIANLTEEERNSERAAAVAELKREDMIIFSPKGETKAAMYVFTDVDCGYCQLMHKQMAKMNELGIEVRYLAYPRAGLNSPSYNKVASAWCSDDPQQAMNKLKNREEIPHNVCKDNPVAEHYQLGQTLGISGTPALVFESGQLVGGYVEPDRLAPMLGIN